MGLNVCYLILSCLFLIVLILYLRRKRILFIYKIIIIGLYVLITFLSCSYFNGIFNSIFKLKYLNAKAYLGLIVISNIILLYTFNRSIRLWYKVCNILLFMFLIFNLVFVISVLLGNRYEVFYLMDVSNAVNFVDLSFIAFLFYLITICIIYIGYNIFSSNNNIKSFFVNLIMDDELEPPDVLSPEEVLSYREQGDFYINGVDASIIFDNSSLEDIVMNYYILYHDINAKLLNGFTLDENKMLKNICIKLEADDLNSIDLNDASVIDKINDDEYNLLKKVYERLDLKI